MSRTAIGIDVGGTKIAGAVIDLESGRVLERRRVETVATEGGAAVAGRIAEMAAELGGLPGFDPVGVGIGLPELISSAGKVMSAYNFDIRNIPSDTLGAGLPVAVDSDVRCGARGELLFGAGKGLESFSYVSIGTGISAVQVFGGHIHHGKNGYAIHFGSSDIAVFSGDGSVARFNLEAEASGGALARAAGKTTVDIGVMLDGTAGKRAQDLARASIEAMASFLGQMINMLDPGALVIGGGMGLSAAYLAQLKAALPGFIWAEYCHDIPVVPARLGADAGMIGAAAKFA